MKIEFERIERDCPFNKDIRKAGETLGILYDYRVICDGVYIACFRRNDSKYWLADSGDAENTSWVRYPVRGGVIEVKKQADFRDTIVKYYKEIPTPEQVADRLVKKRQAETVARHNAEVRARVHRMEQRAETMYEMLVNLYKAGVISMAKEVIEFVEQAPAPKQAKMTISELMDCDYR